MYKINKIAHICALFFVHFVEFFGKTEKTKKSVDNESDRVYNKGVIKRCLCYKGEEKGNDKTRIFRQTSSTYGKTNQRQ